MKILLSSIYSSGLVSGLAFRLCYFQAYQTINRVQRISMLAEKTDKKAGCGAPVNDEVTRAVWIIPATMFAEWFAPFSRTGKGEP